MEWIIFLGICAVIWIISAVSDGNKPPATPQSNIPPTASSPTLEDAVVQWEMSQTAHPDLNELLKSHIGMKDLVTGETLSPGDEVYFCSICKLSHLKKSWEFLNNRCERNDCQGNEVARLCRLPGGDIIWNDLF